MSTGSTSIKSLGVLDALLNDDVYLPPEPKSLEETGISPVVIETLVMKFLLQVGSSSGHDVAKRLCLPFAILEDLLLALRSRQMLQHKGQAQLGDYYYSLTDQGADRARAAMRACAYVGPVPVLLEDYILSVDAQTIRAEAAKRHQLEEAFSDISVAQRSIPERVCFCTEHRVTARQPLPSELRNASAKAFGFHERSPKMVSSLSTTTLRSMRR